MQEKTILVQAFHCHEVIVFTILLKIQVFNPCQVVHVYCLLKTLLPITNDVNIHFLGCAAYILPVEPIPLRLSSQIWPL